MTTSALAVPFHAAPVEDRPAAAIPARAQRFYRPELDALRFFAFLLVFMLHSTNGVLPVISHCGAFGLSLFFLLSAFLITELLQREVAATGTLNIPAFYVRRILRIWPLYYGFLLFSLLIGYFSPLHHTTWQYNLSYAFMVGNVYFGRHDISYAPSLFLWSISVEEQFYLFWPLLNKYLNRNLLKLTALAAFPIAMLAILVIGINPARGAETVWTSSLVQFQVFACGVLLSLVLNGRIPTLQPWVRAALFLGSMGTLYMAARWSGAWGGYHGLGGVMLGYLAVSAGCTGIFLSIYGVPWNRVPSVLVYLGKISFSLYVWHKICLETVAGILNRIPATNTTRHHGMFGVSHVVCGLALTILMSMLSYHFVEMYFLKLKDRFAVVPSRRV